LWDQAAVDGSHRLIRMTVAPKLFAKIEMQIAPGRNVAKDLKLLPSLLVEEHKIGNRWRFKSVAE
jgi:hypothetical protein